MQKKPGETIKETSICVRPEWVNKWPESVLAGWWWWKCTVFERHAAKSLFYSPQNSIHFI